MPPIGGKLHKAGANKPYAGAVDNTARHTEVNNESYMKKFTACILRSYQWASMKASFNCPEKYKLKICPPWSLIRRLK